MAALAKPRNRDGFKIAVICALTKERDAVMEMLDGVWKAADYGKAAGDPNTYRMGRIGSHNVVIVQLPEMGTRAAASTSASFRFSFPNITLGLVVGICGGVPTKTASGEILMGDVIISNEIVDYTFGRQYDHKFAIKDTLADSYGRPITEIRSFLKTMEGKRDRLQLKNDSLRYLVALLEQRGFESSRFPGAHKDITYPRTYRHKHQRPGSCEVCAQCQAAEDELERAVIAGKMPDVVKEAENKVKMADVCRDSEERFCEDLGCEKMTVRGSQTRSRQVLSLKLGMPEIHFGVIGSGNSVLKSGYQRDALAQEKKIIAFEMEGAGVWDNFPTVVIKAVCDYADGHKSKKWQEYAAASAAACMKAFLKEWSPEGTLPDHEPTRKAQDWFGFKYLRSFRNVQMEYLRSAPWTTLEEDHVGDEPSNRFKSWSGGVYQMQYPTEDPTATILLSIDWHAFEGDPFAPIFDWTIDTYQSLYFPGTHRGRFFFKSLVRQFDQRFASLHWSTPIFCPFVSASGTLSSDGPLEELSYFCSNLTPILQGIAHFLAYGPFPDRYGPTAPFGFHAGIGSLDTTEYFKAVDPDQFARASSFFARAYTVRTPEADEFIGKGLSDDCWKTSVTVIRELLEWYDKDLLKSSKGEEEWNFEEQLQKVKSHREWALEERKWADKVAHACKLQFVCRAAKNWDSELAIKVSPILQEPAIHTLL